MRLAFHVLVDCIVVTLIALFALGLASGELFPSGRLKLFAEIWIYTLLVAIAGHWLLPYGERFVAGLNPVAQWLALAVQLALIGLLGGLLGSFVIYSLDLEPGATFIQIVSLATKLVIYLTVLIGLVHAIVITLFEKMHAHEVEAERARKLASEARLASLESHVHPHFLFNTLNTISSLVQTAPDRAELLIERVSRLLRFSLNNRDGGLVPLADEIRIVRDYLEIEQERFGERLRFQIDVMPDSLDCQVPPLSVQTLVENSVKHAVSPNRSGAEIRVAARVLDGLLSIGVADTGPGFSAEDLSNGSGLRNLRDRLGVLFKAPEPLAINHDGGWTTVRFTVPA